jgi:hypothetical protein
MGTYVPKYLYRNSGPNRLGHLFLFYKLKISDLPSNTR